METDIYGTTLGSGLISSFIAWGAGLLIIIGGFIFASRLLIGRRLDQAEREWRARQDAEADARKAAEGGSGSSDGETKDKPER